MKKRGGVIGYSLMTIIVIAIAVFIYDLLFTKPQHLNGTVVEKIFVPGRNETGATPYGGIRRGNYSVTVQKEDQWIALVKMENGDTLKVHCHPTHYKEREVGDVIHFSKYEGKLLHIQYFAHNEEED